MSPQLPPPIGQKASEFVSLRYVKYVVSRNPTPPSPTYSLSVKLLEDNGAVLASESAFWFGSDSEEEHVMGSSRDLRPQPSVLWRKANLPWMGRDLRADQNGGDVRLANAKVAISTLTFHLKINCDSRGLIWAGWAELNSCDLNCGPSVFEALLIAQPKLLTGLFWRRAQIILGKFLYLG